MVYLWLHLATNEYLENYTFFYGTRRLFHSSVEILHLQKLQIWGNVLLVRLLLGLWCIHAYVLWIVDGLYFLILNVVMFVSWRFITLACSLGGCHWPRRPSLQTPSIVYVGIHKREFFTLHIHWLVDEVMEIWWPPRLPIAHQMPWVYLSIWGSK